VTDVQVVIVGGCGRVGLPLGLALARAGADVTLFDLNAAAVERVQAGTMPFHEDDADDLLTEVLAAGRLQATADRSSVSGADHVIVVIGTPVDEHLNPQPDVVLDAIRELVPHLRDGQHLVLRSTLYPGVTQLVHRLLQGEGLDVAVSFCPERIAEGKALVELNQLPQIISGCTADATARAAKLFGTLTEQLVELDPTEAELAKLFTNTWRYIKFAAANQLFMIANDFGADFERIRRAVTLDYPRAADMPGAGLAAGPCLFKDTMQLAAFNNNNFTLGHASMLVNEGMPLYLVARMEEQHDLAGMTVAILGMAFKAESDDPRDSLSYKLKRLLGIKAQRVVCTDPYVRGDDIVPLEQALAEADLVVVATPHAAYRDLQLDVPAVDLWGVLGQGNRV
jgi:UDP-N-acetyl-D-mannosaminuronic acid dehydrogenase